MGQIEIYQNAVFGRRNNDAFNNWEEIDLDKFEINKPIVFSLSGNEARYPSLASGFSRRSEVLLQLLLNDPQEGGLGPDKKVDFVGCAYGCMASLYLPNATDKELQKIKKDYRSFKALYSRFGKKIKFSNGSLTDGERDKFAKLILSKLMDKNGKKISLEKACKNMSYITFFTWCHGSYEVEKILSRVWQQCYYTLDYTREEMVQMFSCLMQVSYAPIVYTKYCPLVAVDSMHDDLKLAIDMFKGESVSSIEMKLEKADFEKKNYFDKIFIKSEKMANNLKEHVNEHSIKMIDRDDNWNSMVDSTKVYSYNPGNNADCVSQMMSWALSRSVENSLLNERCESFVQRQDFEELFDELVSIKNDYSEEQLLPRE